MNAQEIENVVRQTVVIYTIKYPDPKTGKPDCRLTTMFKQQRQASMRLRLHEAAGDEERIKAIIERYARTEQ